MFVMPLFSSLWLPLLGLDGVCAAAASELAFGGCAPPISRCETGKLFNSLIHLQSSFAVLSEEINILLIAPHRFCKGLYVDSAI